jgi:O-succinylbenzoic acid--CoA ligase
MSSPRFLIFDKVLNPLQFAVYKFGNLHFAGVENGQEFVTTWLNDKQFFDQKTSGSTGKPTVHKVSRSNMIASAARTVSALSLPHGLKALICINMAYIGGKMMLARGLQYNWQMQVIPTTSFASDEQIPDGPFDFCAMVPMQIENLLKSAKGVELLNSIKTIIVGGAPVGSHLIEQMQQLSCSVYATYGMTETVSHIALQKLNGIDSSNHFSLLEGVAHELDDRSCLRLKADVTDSKWIQTNDIVEFRSDKSFRVIGRADNVINTGGVKVHIEQLEAKIAPLIREFISDFAITSSTDPMLGEKIVFVFSAYLGREEDIISHLKPALDKFEVPKEIFQLEIPKTPSGKIDRPQLRARVLRAVENRKH